MKRFRNNVAPVFMTAVVTALLVFSGCANKNEPAWMKVNKQLVKEHGITERQRDDMVDTGIVSNLDAGKVTNISQLPEVEFAPGVKGRMYWGKGALVNWMVMEPGSEIPKETLNAERLLVMVKGSIEQLVNGQMVSMTCSPDTPGFYFAHGYVGTRDCVFLENGTENAVKAGPEGAEFLEVYSPVRLDYMQKAGVTPPENPNFGDFKAERRFPANQVFNYYDVQRTELVPDADSRLISGDALQASFLFMQPGSKFGHHNHPEEQIMIVFDGSIDEIILDGQTTMKTGDIVYFPAYMVHGGVNGPEGCNVLDVFWPVRTDYQASETKRYEALNAIIPEGEAPKLIADLKANPTGNPFLEGGVYVNGKLIFSGMFFDIPAGTWKSDARKSSVLSLDLASGKVSTILKGRQTNGMALMPNGNIAVCDMAGHQIFEMTPEGKVVKVLADKLSDGTRLDGPNDVVVDAKGGMYFTDPQFIFDEKKRAGETVNYIKPNGEVIEVIAPGEFGMANGIELSPDGKLLYVNNTYHNEANMSEVENWVIAYDVNEDGTLSGKRKFARMFLPQSEYNQGSRSSCSDGCAVDQQGNLYQATSVGVQIFNPEGKYIGNIHTPFFPVNICFGGPNNDVLYMMAWDKVYSIQTKVQGLVLPNAVQ